MQKERDRTPREKATSLGTRVSVIEYIVRASADRSQVYLSKYKSNLHCNLALLADGCCLFV